MRKTYPVGVALAVASGRLLCDFAALHEAVTDLAGWPVMSHHMANQALMDGCAEKIIRQVRWMPGAIENMPDWSAFPRDDVRRAIADWLTRIADVHGHDVTIEVGEPLAVLTPFEGLQHLGGGVR